MIEVQDPHDQISGDIVDLHRWAELAQEDARGDICIRIVSRTEAQSLNKRFRQRNKATNVLAFPADEPGLLGDVAICGPVVQEEVKNVGCTLPERYAQLIVHGVLHLRGYDHDRDTDASVMEGKERTLLKTLGFGDPYRHHD